jgi:hypothetical protein
MFEAPVDRLGRAVAGARSVEIGQDVGGPFLRRPPERDQFLQGFGTRVLNASISAAMSVRPWSGFEPPR